jgi:hypothetical protein
VGASTTLSPPISTDLAELRAIWVNCRGAVAHNERTWPGSNRTVTPLTVAPALRNSCNDSASSRISMPISANNRSAVDSTNARPSSPNNSYGGICRRMNAGARGLAPLPVRVATRADRPPDRCRGASGSVSGIGSLQSVVILFAVRLLRHSTLTKRGGVTMVFVVPPDPRS